MSYQVLARKWRPRVFREMVGQEHVLQALINALDHNRLHHAYLFTGTRGVGKTTIARILAKCLNCETGVSSEPCGQCSACREIAEGRFVDLIEVDAASRTKVEDTRELLENVQYAPTRGRYKVYLIDEVHMLSNSSFNALLKTLEEPPPHVKFLLATTDPQKLPMTILSRCLQFNLKNMTPERIVNHLKFVLEQEMVPYEEAALWHLGRAADGSMRDAMSLTDQAIAYGSGKIADAEVTAMLGTIDQASIQKIIESLIAQDGKNLLQTVAMMSEQSPDYAGALAELLSTLHRIAIAQALPEALDNSRGDRDKILNWAQSLTAEDVQLFYQTALLGRRDLPLAPDPRAGLEMVLLRMLAFKPGPFDPKMSAGAQPAKKPEAAKPPVTVNSKTEAVVEPVQESKAPVSSVASLLEKNLTDLKPDSTLTLPLPGEGTSTAVFPQSLPREEKVTQSSPQLSSVVETTPPSGKGEAGRGSFSAPNNSANETTISSAVINTARQNSLVVETKKSSSVKKIPYDSAVPADWPMIFRGLSTSGILHNTAMHCECVGRQGNRFHFVLDEARSTLYDVSHQQRLADVLTDYFAETISVQIALGKITGETPAMIAERERQARQLEAEAAIEQDPIVQQLKTQMGASIRTGSIEPVIER
jgi:DNA polymerase III subunit gamma/tau